MLDRLRKRFLQYRRVALDLLIVLAIVVILAGTTLLLNLILLTDAIRTSSDISRIRDVVGIIQLFAWAFLIVAGGIFAYRKLRVFRDFEPHLTVTHEVTHRRIGTQYTHIAVTATLKNSSNVRVEIREGYFQLSQIAPIDDDSIVALYRQTFDNDGGDDIQYIQWPLLDNLTRASDANPLVIEPGEAHLETGEFIVSSEVETVLIFSYFYNSQFVEGSKSAQGWTATTAYDIVFSR